MQQLQGKEKIRFSNIFDGNKIKDGSVYPSREMYEDEFNRIWQKQAEFYDILKNEDLKNAFYNAIFYQRPLKSQQRGFCEFEDGEFRIYKAHPLFQRVRALQTINQMEVDDEPLTQEQLQILKDELFKNFKYTTKQGKLSFDKIKKLSGFNESAKFNIEDEEKRPEIYTDKTVYLLSRPECFGDKWFELDDGDKNSVVKMLIDNSLEDDVLIQKAEKKALFENCNTPFDGFDRAKFNEICDKMPISFKPKLKNPKQENSTVGALHEDTAYSLLEFENKKGLDGVL